LPLKIYTSTQHDANAAEEKNQPPAKLLHAPKKNSPKKNHALNHSPSFLVANPPPSKKNHALNHSPSFLVANPPPSRILTVSYLASHSSLPQNHKLVALITSVFPAGFNFLNPEPKRSNFRPPHNRSQFNLKKLPKGFFFPSILFIEGPNFKPKHFH
jgi:hypothetical protein